MRTTYVRNTFLHVLISINLCVYVTITRSTIRVLAQTGCPTNAAYGQRYSFAPNTKLTVYLDSSFNSTQRDGIMAGLSTWTNANGATGNSSGIVIDHWIIGAPPSPQPQNSISVVSGTPVVGTPPAGIRGQTAITPGTNYAQSSVITIDSRVTDRDAMQEVASHEGGHGIFGLNNVDPSVSQTDSIMAHSPSCASDATVTPGNEYYDPYCGGVADYNVLRPLSGPTPCDNLAAKQNGGYGNPNPPQPNPPASSGGGTRQDQSFWTGNFQNRACYQWFQVSVVMNCSGSSGCVVSITYYPVGSPICF